jgi:Na+/melibiose symporter-like transporter
MGLFLCVYFIAAILSIPVWRLCAHRFGEIKMWGLSIALAFLFAAMAYFIKQGDVFYYVLYCAFSGIAFGGEVYLPSIILSQLINKNKLSTDTAFYFGGYAFVMKLMFAIASAAVYIALYFVGFEAEMVNAAPALIAIVLLYTFIPAIIKLASLLALKYGGLNEKNSDNFIDGERHVS